MYICYNNQLNIIMKTQEKIYRSRVSILLFSIILLAFTPMFNRVNTTMMCVLGIILSFVLLILTGIRYIISGNKIIIKLWFISMGSVDILKIKSINRSYNRLSSPASSLKRLSIYRCETNNTLDALISPVREQAFLEELLKINPDIKINVSNKKGLWRIWDWDI